MGSGALQAGGHEALHWRDVGAHNAPDTEIMVWAKREGFTVFTHDLDYGAILFATGAVAPSVIQIRGEDVRPQTMAGCVIAALAAAEEDLLSGSLVTIDPRRNRIAFLPLRK